jgi:hypothetical protein
MNAFDHALRLARLGFHAFPLIANAKLPGIEDFPNRSTTDEVTLRRWFFDEVMELPHPYNVGISTTRYGDDQALVVVDVDDKNGKSGSAELLKLEMQGLELPETFTQYTPSGGRHLVFRAPAAVKQGVNVLGTGLDVRSQGGFIVGSGSTIDGKAYTDNGKPIAEAPQWLIERCGKPIERRQLSAEPPASVDQDAARQRVVRYLTAEAPESIKGNGGDHTAYKVAARVKDLGVSEEDALDLMMEHWFEGSGWSRDRLAEKVAHVYRYGKAPVGAAAPDAQFKPVEQPAGEAQSDGTDGHPANRYNREFAFVLIGGSHYILWETRDAEGNTEVRYISEETFLKFHTGDVMLVQKEKKDGGTATETVKLPKLWLDAPGRSAPPGPTDPLLWRRTYRGVWFAPEQPCPDGYYNQWRGFRYTPLTQGEKPDKEHIWAVDAWYDHMVENVCGGDAQLAHWLTGWVAHLVQRPWEKPLVALVLKGAKGTGKNSWIERIRDLIGPPHAMTAIHRRYLTGQFNGHMDSMLLLIVDEAIWAGDKEGEGVLKGLVTGSHHAIERKGKEIYQVPNLTRLVILGNEDWLVPASHDERRFAVFEMGKRRQKDKPYFERMRKALSDGGARLLLRRLLDFDLSTVDVNEAPATDALLEQKVETLSGVGAWWLSCLQAGKILGADFAMEWPDTPVDTAQLYGAFKRHAREHRTYRVPTDAVIGKQLKKVCAGLGRTRLARNGSYAYVLPSLADARDQWAAHMNQRIDWSNP